MAKTLCEWSGREIERKAEKLARITAEPVYFCRRCARVASRSKYLCKPCRLPVPRAEVLFEA